jgi:signal transduction histidine kinase
VREKILSNERYGAVEIDKTGIITGFNRTASAVLVDLGKINSAADLRGMSIVQFADGGDKICYDPADPEKSIASILFFIDGILLIDNVFYKDTESAIIRFLKNNQALLPFFNMVKFSSSLYIELDPDLNILFASDAFCRTAAIEKSQFYGRSISIFTDKKSTAELRASADRCKQNINESVKSDGMHFTFNCIIRNFDVEVFPVIDTINGYSGILCYLSDRSFENKCRDMGRTIRRMSAVANFAGGIAHDYNNALTAVLGNISLAKMDAEKNTELEELLRDAESAGLKIKTLTERLGMFARGMKPAKNKTDIRKLIEKIIPDLFSGYQGHCVINIHDNLKNPEIDQELISEAIRHIIENAIDAADNPDGEIVIKVSEIEICDESVFRETSLVSGNYIVISIKDNGPGLEQYSYSEIFDPYVTTKDGREGLGLALAYTILKRHRGFISADTPEGGGADFKVYIPLF